jgi:hypothetical protein
MAIRMIDVNEQALVLNVDYQGLAYFRVGKVCPRGIASLLRELADRVEASHPPFPCDWDERRGEPEPADRPAEPLVPDRGSLDADAQVWTDGTGHRWDLSVPWDDVTDVRWHWTGRMDGQGVPLMRSNDGEETASLDVIRAVTGPIAPVVGTEG